jgi:hypothetical protein
MQTLKGDAGWLWRIGLVLLGLLLLGSGRANGEDFSIVVLPDPQFYAATFPDVGLAQTEWICKNKEKLQIKFVVTVGDNVDAGDSDCQFKNSRRFMDHLENVVPYGLACGNHDLKDGTKGSYTSHKFIDYYGPQRFKKHAWYGGASESGFSSYQVFSGGGYTFLALELTVAAPKAEVQWAKKVLADNPHIPVILTTHQMLTPTGNLGQDTAVSSPDAQTPAEVWEQLVQPSPQIFLVLCGHYHGEAHITKKTQATQPVHVILQDYQNESNGGNGWLRIFTFLPAASKVEVQTFSPTLDEYKKGSTSAFNFALDFKQLVAPVPAK